MLHTHPPAAPQSQSGCFGYQDESHWGTGEGREVLHTHPRSSPDAARLSGVVLNSSQGRLPRVSLVGWS